MKSTAGDNQLGGDNRSRCDCIEDKVRKDQGVDLAPTGWVQRLYEAAEKAKIELS